MLNVNKYFTTQVNKCIIINVKGNDINKEMIKMSEKQSAFIQKLLAEKAIEMYELQANYHYATGGRSQLPAFEDMNSKQASWVIEQLLKAPKRKTAEQIAHFQNACDKYEQLVQWAKQQGLKVRSKMKKQSILKAISEAGLQVPAELI